MKAITLVEIDLNVCSLTYGSAPCTASGDKKCFNSVRTCQDAVNYAASSVTLRFAIDNGLVPREIEAIPSVLDVSLTAAQIAPGEGLGVRASCNVTFADHPFADTAKGFDKYLADRDYDPFRLGTFWAKMRSRHPYLKGQKLRVIRGFVPASFAQTYVFGDPLPDGVLTDQETRTYLIESYDGAKDDLTFQIVGKDILKIADGDRALAPKPSNGRLSADLAIDGTQLTMTPAGVGAAEYPASGHVTIGGKEVVSFARSAGGKNANTQLLLHFDGADNSTTITDSSGNGRNGTCNGNAKLQTADKKYGSASALFPGGADSIIVADHNAWAFGTASFTIDCWCKVDDLASNRTIVSHSNNNTTDHWTLLIGTDGSLQFIVYSASSLLFGIGSAAGTIVSGERCHIAVERQGTTFRLYKNGSVVATSTSSVSIPNFTGWLRIGLMGNAATSPMKGWIDEFRIQSESAFQGSFTPAPYAEGSDVLFIDRGQKNTAAQAHSAQDRVQLMLTYDAQDPADVIYDLVTTYAGGDPSYFDLDQWKAETSVYLNQLVSASIAEPTAVRKLIEELIRQTQIVIWQDELSEKVNLRVLRAVPSNAVVYGPDDYLDKSFTSREQPEKRKSQILTLFAQRDPTKKLDDSDNYRSGDLRIDSASEVNYGPAIEQIYSRWFPAGSRSVVERMADNIISRYSDAPRRFSLELFKTTTKKPLQAMPCFVAARSLQDDTGAPENVPAIVTRVESTPSTYKIELEEARGGAEPQDLVNRIIYIEETAYNVNLRDLHDSIYAPITGDDVTNGVNLTLRIPSSSKIGSVSRLLPALDIGDWIDDDFPITIELDGKIQGKGGRGANGNNAFNYLTNLPAEDGGVAIYTRRPITIKHDGKIWSGGGGGGGGGSAYWNNDTGGAGGGGSGLDGGDAAWGYSTSYPSSPGTEDDGGNPGTPVGSPGFTHPGGKGGGPGQDGAHGTQNPGGVPRNPRGLAGAAIDGDSYVTIDDSPDIRGPQIN